MSKPRWIPAHLRTGTEEQSAVARFWGSIGGIVYKTSDTRQVAATPGIADQLVILPNRALIVAWESKGGSEQYAPDDPRRLTDEQRAFLAYWSRGYVTAAGHGDALAAQRWIMARSTGGATR